MNPIHAEGAEPGEPDLAEAGCFASRREAFEHGLVVLAVGEPYWLVQSEGRFHLLVERPALGLVRDELACYDRESLGWPPAPPRRTGRTLELASPLLWAISAALVFGLQGFRPGLLEDWGSLDSQGVFDRAEWWRPATALFLHADIGHLVSNLAFGILAFSAVLSSVGRWRGWALIAAASLTGNLAIAALYYPGPYRSLGASTAIFAALGILTGRAIRAVVRDPASRRWQAVFAPAAAGLTVLALFGAGGFEVDVGAHATGFAAGVAWGFGLGARGGSPTSGDTPMTGGHEAA
jgi:membrane associated rhomboid family serine protease